MMKQRRSMLAAANSKKYKIILQGLSTVSHMPTLLNPCTITDTGTPSNGKFDIWFKVNNGNSITYSAAQPLRCTYSPALPYSDTSPQNAYGTIGARDYIEITSDSVNLYQNVISAVLPTLVSFGSSGNSTTGFALGGAVGWIAFLSDNLLSTHFKPLKYAYNAEYYAEYGVASTGSRLYFMMPKADIGVPAGAATSEHISYYNSFLSDQISTLGADNCRIYCGRRTPVVTNLTDTTFGQQARAALRQCNGSNITGNADILIEEVQ